MATESEDQPHQQPDPPLPSESRRVEKPDAQHVEELRAELTNARSAKERKVIAEELALASDYLATANLLAQFEDRRAGLEARDPGLAARIDCVASSFHESPVERLRDARFKSELAYALQDAEKLEGRIFVDSRLRDELTRLAVSSPGLKNPQMQNLMRMTPAIDDVALVARLREKAAEIAGKSNQTTKAIQSDLNALAYELLNAQRSEPIDVSPADPDEGAGPTAPAKSVKPALASPSSDTARAEIGAFDGPAVTNAAPLGPPANSNGAPPPRIEEQVEKALDRDRTPIGAEGPLRRSNESLPASETTGASEGKPRTPEPSQPPSRSRDAKTELDALEGSSPSRDRARPTPGFVQASESSRRDARASSRAVASDAPRPANDDHKLGTSASRPASPALQSEPPRPPEADGAEAAGKEREVEVLQQRLVIGGVFGKAVGAVGRSASAFGRILEAATPSSQTSRPPLQQPAEQQTNRDEVRQRLQAYEQTRMQPKRDDFRLHAADASGHAALEAFSAFRATPGASILDRIQDAAASNKGGMRAVIAGMKPGGAFEDLRKEFNVALVESDAFGAAYERAANALARYGKDREGVVSALASHPNASSWNDHFKKLDAAVGEAASEMPGKKPATDMLGHLGETAREIVEKALEKIRGIFQRDPESRPSPSPGP
jgi:hypothetical protein